MRHDKLAVVGGGAAGIAALWALRQHFDVTLYEAATTLGGHAQSTARGGSPSHVPIDLAVQLFTSRSHPNLLALFELLGLKCYDSPLSFSAHFPGAMGAWSNEGAQTPLAVCLRDEALRFHSDMACVGRDPHLYADIDIGTFLHDNGYSQQFAAAALLPILSVLAGTRAAMLRYSVSYCALLFNFELLSFVEPCQWQRLCGGVATYIDAMKARCCDESTLRQDTAVQRVERSSGAVQITDSSGRCDTFSQVIFATHADVSLRLLADPMPLERVLLGSFSYDPAISVAHSDASALPPEVRGHLALAASCIYEAPPGPPRTGRLGATTFNYNRIAMLPDDHGPLAMTVNPLRPIDPRTVYAQRSWKHPLLRPEDMRIKGRLREIQGCHNTWFCGLDTVTTGHESALTSGLIVAAALGAPYPFAALPAASNHFAFLRGMMGI